MAVPHPLPVCCQGEIFGWEGGLSPSLTVAAATAAAWTLSSVYDLERAKKSYGLLIACAQVGSVAGPTLVTQAASIGDPPLNPLALLPPLPNCPLPWSPKRRSGARAR